MATPAELLVEARAALHRIMTGTAAVEVRDSDGSSIRYTQANASRLRAYIRDLEAQASGSVIAARPLRPVWG